MNTVISIKTDSQLKRSAQKIAEDLGFSLSAILNAYLNQFVRNKEIYFSVAPHMSGDLENLLGDIENDIRSDRNISKKFSSKKELKAYLL